MLDYCGLCGESYDEDNLARCTQCGRDYCYKCGSLGVCDRCREKKEQEKNRLSAHQGGHREGLVYAGLNLIEIL